MDKVRGFEDGRAPGREPDSAAGSLGHPRPEVGTDERRMHVRAYHRWVSLLRGRACPSIEDLDAATIADFGPHSALLDVAGGVADPAIVWVGRRLREECGLGQDFAHIAAIPDRSLLSHLTDQYRRTIADRAPIDFEEEFVDWRGHDTLCRGVLMPFSSGGRSVDYIYGVISWKQLVDAGTQAMLDAELGAARRAVAGPFATAMAWPGDAEERVGRGIGSRAPAGRLAEQLLRARQAAAAVGDRRTGATLHHALGLAHDVALAADADPAAYALLLDRAGIAVQLRAPMMPVVMLVFGADGDRTRLADYAAILSHARRLGVAPGGLAAFLDGFEGGIRGVIRAERRATKPASARPITARSRGGDMVSLS